MASPWLISTGQAFPRDCHQSWPWSWCASPSQPAATAKAVVNASHVPGTRSSSTPFPQLPSMSVPLPVRNQAHIPCHQRLLNYPSSRPPSSRSLASLPPLRPPPLAVYQDAPPPTSVPLPTSVPQPSYSTQPVPLASSPSLMTPSRRSPTSIRVPRPPSTAAAPVKQGSCPSLDKNFPSLSQTRPTRIVPAHSIEDYNRRDYSRSAVPGSVSSLKCTF